MRQSLRQGRVSVVRSSRLSIRQGGPRPIPTPGQQITVEDVEEEEPLAIIDDMDIETIMLKIKAYDAYFRIDDKANIYKQVVFFFKPAMNEEEQSDYDAVSVETYMILTPGYLYLVDLDSLEWLYDPVPIKNLSTMQLSINNNEVALFKRR